jgi:gas vesicle protein
MKRFLAGLITGFVSSLLIVPGPGKSNRAQLKADAQKRGNQLKTELHKIITDVGRLIDAARNQFPR